MRRLVCFLVFTVFAVSFSGHAQAQIQAQTQPHITVVGTGTITAKPDILRLTLGVSATEDDASLAMRRMSDDLARVMATLSALGLPPADIQTSNLFLSERFDNGSYSGPRKMVGFTASSNVDVVLRDLDRAGEVIDLLVSEGANQISGIQFDIADKTPLLTQARIAAVVDAQEKTALYAQAARVKAGAVMMISETTNTGFDISPMLAMDARGSVPIAAGTLDITAQVTVVTAIE